MAETVAVTPTANPYQSSTSVNYDKASVFDAIGNHFTGNLDYKRQVESAIRAEDRSAYEAQKARDFSAAEAEKARKWQEEMSNTAYSRAIADLRRNGINPYAIGMFQQASTPNASLPTAFAGSGYVGSSHGSGGNGVSEILGMLETAFKVDAQQNQSMAEALWRLLRFGFKGIS